MKKLLLLVGLVVFLTPSVYAYAYDGEWTLRETLNCPKQDDDIARTMQLLESASFSENKIIVRLAMAIVLLNKNILINLIVL